MNIRISLQQLIGLFQDSAGNEELPTAVRVLAARLTVFVGHVMRVEEKINAEVKARQALEKTVADLITMIPTLVKPSAQAGQPQQTPTPQNGDVSENTEIDADTMVEDAVRQAEAEAASINAQAATKPTGNPGAALIPIKPNAAAGDA